MTEARFWELIAAYVDVDDAQEVTSVERLEAALSRLAAEEIDAFDALFDRLHAESYRRELWGAAHLLNGRCSDDGFDAFRGWLIARGREVYRRVLADPDALAELCDGYAECEEMLYVARAAYEAVTGEPMTRPALPYPRLAEGWDFDDPAEMRRRYPRLAARAYL